MQSRYKIAKKLAASFIHGPWSKDDIARRIARTFDDERLNAGILTLNLLIKHKTRPVLADLSETIANDAVFMEWVLKLDRAPKMQRINIEPDVMGATPDYVTQDLPALTTYHDLSEWLELSENDLAWFADCEGRQARVKEQKLHHYTYQWIKRKQGYPRLIEIPKAALKSKQRQILRAILDHVTPHDAVHGFRKNRSCKTHAVNHVGKDVVLRMDLENFFPSVAQARVIALFYALGYPRTVARNLAGLCINNPSPDLMGVHYHRLPWQRQKTLLQPHLPQGAPTSPVLANLCAWKFDKRLQGLADTMELTYSRYADDMVFSGGTILKKHFHYVRKVVEEIAIDEGFRINNRKTRIMTQAQRQSIVGVTVNERPNIARTEYDTLKAILHNCVHQGVSGQNRAEHSNFQSYLRGKIAHIGAINQAKAQKLISQYEKIDWNT